VDSQNNPNKYLSNEEGDKGKAINVKETIHPIPELVVTSDNENVSFRGDKQLVQLF